MSTLFVIMYGTPIFGFGVLGPFASEEAATEWADRNYQTDDWWVCPLGVPGEVK